MPKVLIHDPTLRDGSHALKHQLTVEQIERYAEAAEKTGVYAVEVGHGNGLGASSLQVGLSLLNDRAMLEAARKKLDKVKLGVHAIPGFATVERDLRPAVEIGVDIVRVASHCTESDITQRHISFVREKGKEVYGTLMMSHMASDEILVEEAKKLESYGADGVVIMDSAGASLPSDVTSRVSALVHNLSIPVTFHAHNNLGMGIANSLAAVAAGATTVDGCAAGFGAGAGNAQLEVLVAVLEKAGYSTGVDLYSVLDLSDVARKYIVKTMPAITPTSIVNGLAGVFSGFRKHVERIAAEFDVDPRDVFFALGRMRVVAGQEDKIIEVAQKLRAAKGRKDDARAEDAIG
jgi:4-hydroxy 2-oxovalerate aldolase